MTSLAATSAAALAVLSLAACGTSMLASKESYLESGNRFLEQGKDEDAIIQYRKALQKDQKYGDAYYRLGLAYRRTQKSQDAFSSFSKAVELLPKSNEAKAQLGDLALSGFLGDPRRPRRLYEMAHEMASALLAGNPGSHEGLRIRGYLAMAESDLTSAVNFFLKADQAKPNQPDVVSALVQALTGAKRNQEAESRALALIQTKPTFGPIYDLLYGYYRSAGRDNDAGELLKRKIANNPGEPFYSIQLADFEWARGRHQEADMIVKALLSAQPLKPHVAREAGSFYSRRRQWDKAIVAYRRGLNAKQSGDITLQKSLTRAYLETGNTDAAIQLLDGILRSAPKDTEARTSRASLRILTKDGDEIAKAVAEFRDLVETHPKDSSLRYALARALRDVGLQVESRRKLIEVVALDPSHTDALRDLASLAIADQDPTAALRYADQVLALSRSDPAARLVRTAAWAVQGRLAAVRTELTSLLQELPNLPEAQVQMALLELAEKKYVQAYNRFQKLHRPGSDDIRPLKGLVEVHFARGNSAEAVAAVEREYQVNPKSEGLLSLLASSAERAGKPEPAIEALEHLTQLESKPKDTVPRLAKLYHKQGSVGKAIALLQSAGKTTPTDPVIFALLGSFYSESGQLDHSIQSYRESLKLDPESFTAANNLAFALAEQGTDLTEALRLAKTAVQKSSNNSYCVDTLGYVYLKQGQFETARQTFSSLVSREPKVQQFHVHLAMAFNGKGEHRNARIELESAIKLDPASPDAKKAQAILDHVAQ